MADRAKEKGPREGGETLIALSARGGEPRVGATTSEFADQ